jgi:hypothetical protein
MRRLLIAAVLALAALAAPAKADNCNNGWGCHQDCPFCLKFCDFFGYRPAPPPVYFMVQAVPGHDYWPMVPVLDPGMPMY